jgi:hypothetical protein
MAVHIELMMMIQYGITSVAWCSGLCNLGMGKSPINYITRFECFLYVG